ncbi:ATP-binding protein [Pseudonocardia sp. RS010]|uniref:ATP-binding protein n=1 Tax=Pseudonocardia sp. RS010 TaxID=3385979 RepID=UPI0039A113DD
MAPPSEQDEQASGRRHPRVNGFGSHGPTVLELSLRADLVSASIARDELAAWLVDHAWPPAHADELVLVVSEAVTNSIQHGYGVGPDTYDHPGLVRVRAEVGPGPHGFRRVHLVVSDDGRWREPAERLRPGHGLFLIRALVAEMTIDGRSEGTTVTIASRVSPVR